MKKTLREMSKSIGKMMKTDKAKAEEMKGEVTATKAKMEENEKLSEQLSGERDGLMAMIGNIVHMDIKVARDEDLSNIVGAWGTGPQEFDPTGKVSGAVTQTDSSS